MPKLFVLIDAEPTRASLTSFSLQNEQTKFVFMTQHITLPNTWTPPKYRFGQMVKQGQIVVMEYYPPGSYRASQHGEGWVYGVAEPDSEDTEHFPESCLRPLNPEELQALITEEIESHSQRVAVLKEQLEQALV